MKVLQAFYTEKSPIPPPIIIPPKPQEFFLPEGLLSPTKSSSSTPFQPQTFEIGESSQKSTIERHEEQIEEILNHPVARMPPKRASTTEAPAMTQDAIDGQQKKVDDSRIAQQLPRSNNNYRHTTFAKQSSNTNRRQKAGRAYVVTPSENGRYEYIKNHKKTVKNSQKQANTNTRNGRAQKKPEMQSQSQKKSKKSKLWSTSSQPWSTEVNPQKDKASKVTTLVPQVF
ncbi:hypothetical protein Tco_1562391 [Tanacetum coccineum]